MDIVFSIILTAAVVSLLWWRLGQSYRVQASHAEADLKSMDERLENAQVEMEHHRDAVFDAMTDGILVCSLKGEILFWNSACRRMFQLPETLPDHLTLLEAVRLHEVQEVFQRTIEKGRMMGVHLKPRGAEALHLMLNAVLVHHSSGKPGSVLLNFHDLTQLKELENARRDFVANVSHELRTPLSMIKGFVETIMDHPKMEEETLMNFLGKVQKHSDRLALLVGDLLTISKLESSQATVNLHEVSLFEEVSRVMNDMERAARVKGVTLKIDIPDAIKVKADPGLLEQMIINLVDNAIKYGSTDGCVEVRGSFNGNGQICVSVKDDGPGIPPEALDRIFERFFRVDKARSRAQGGTGLGLSIVKHIAQTLGGRVWVESQLGKGTTFFFTLILSEESHSQPQLMLEETRSAAKV